MNLEVLLGALTRFRHFKTWAFCHGGFKVCPAACRFLLLPSRERLNVVFIYLIYKSGTVLFCLLSPLHVPRSASQLRRIIFPLNPFMDASHNFFEGIASRAFLNFTSDLATLGFEHVLNMVLRMRKPFDVRLASFAQVICLRMKNTSCCTALPMTRPDTSCGSILKAIFVKQVFSMSGGCFDYHLHPNS